jgi:hypothetical protein
MKLGIDPNARRFVHRTDCVRDDLPWASADALDHFLAVASTSYGQFRTASAQTDPEDPELVPYAENPLERWPLIATERSGFVMPIPVYMIHKIGMGLYLSRPEFFGGSAAWNHAASSVSRW